MIKTKIPSSSKLEDLNKSYDDVIKSTVQEQDHWSEGSLSSKNVVGSITGDSTKTIIPNINPLLAAIGGFGKIN